MHGEGRRADSDATCRSASLCPARSLAALHPRNAQRAAAAASNADLLCSPFRASTATGSAARRKRQCAAESDAMGMGEAKKACCCMYVSVLSGRPAYRSPADHY